MLFLYCICCWSTSFIRHNDNMIPIRFRSVCAGETVSFPYYILSITLRSANNRIRTVHWNIVSHRTIVFSILRIDVCVKVLINYCFFASSSRCSRTFLCCEIQHSSTESFFESCLTRNDIATDCEHSVADKPLGWTIIITLEMTYANMQIDFLLAFAPQECAQIRVKIVP